MGMAFKRIEGFKAEVDLIGKPYRQMSLEEMRGAGPGSFTTVEIRQVIRDADGDIIFAHAPGKALAAMLAEALNKPLFVVRFIASDGITKENQVAFGLPDGVTLGAEERAALGMAAWIDSRYHPGVKRAEKTLLPEALDVFTSSEESYTGLPTIFYDEALANDLAGAIGRVYRMQPRIVRDGGRWGIVLKDERPVDTALMMEFLGIHRLLERYDITPKAAATVKLGSSNRADYHEFAFAGLIENQTKADDGRDAQLVTILARLDALADTPKAKTTPSGLSKAGKKYAAMHGKPKATAKRAMADE